MISDTTALTHITYRTHARARHVRLRVLHDGSVIVTHPLRASRSSVERIVLGKKLWILRTLQRMKKNNHIVLPYGVRDSTSYAQHKERARDCVENHLLRYKDTFRWGKVRITNTKTRWGSCSTRGTLSFNWRIVLLPYELQEYLIAHELCHLKVHNHSPRFWKEVSQYIPDYEKSARALKRYQF